MSQNLLTPIRELRELVEKMHKNIHELMTDINERGIECDFCDFNTGEEVYP